VHGRSKVVSGLHRMVEVTMEAHKKTERTNDTMEALSVKCQWTLHTRGY
jgi:hypothetical protein